MAVGASQIDIEEIAKPMYSNPKMKKVFYHYRVNAVIFTRKLIQLS